MKLLAIVILVVGINLRPLSAQAVETNPAPQQPAGRASYDPMVHGKETGQPKVSSKRHSLVSILRTKTTDLWSRIGAKRCSRTHSRPSISGDCSERRLHSECPSSEMAGS